MSYSTATVISSSRPNLLLLLLFIICPSQIYHYRYIFGSFPLQRGLTLPSDAEVYISPRNIRTILQVLIITAFCIRPINIPSPRSVIFRFSISFLWTSPVLLITMGAPLTSLIFYIHPVCMVSSSYFFLGRVGLLHIPVLRDGNIN